MSEKTCPVCGGSCRLIGKGMVLNRHRATFVQCEACGFSAAKNPHWLPEAYDSAITSTDIGYALRCQHTVAASRILFGLLFSRNARFLDYGGGFGLFTRMMRDRGFHFSSFDPYCPPLFAAGAVTDDLESVPAKKFDAVTCFEVFEHLESPVETLEKILQVTSTVFFTTLLISRPAPALPDWWYYSLHHGQHIAFFTRESLEILARRHGLHFYSDNHNFHLLSSRRIPRLLFRLLMKGRLARVLGFLIRRPSLLPQDHERLLALANAR